MAGPATILVIDDNAANRALFEAALGDEGYRVVSVSSGRDGLAAFVREQPDCILLDVHMPELDGPATCRHLRALPGGAAVPVVFVTAVRDVETFDRALLAGGDDYLTKPVRPSDLVARVASALHVRRLARERDDLYHQLKQQRDDLQRLHLQKEDLLGFVVHDLKNPVHAIDLQAQLVVRDRDAGERARRAGGRIRDESRTLLRRITTLLDIARADAGALAPARRRVDLAPLVETVLADLQPRADAAGVRLVHHLDVPAVDADAELLQRVLENLVENAIRHAPEGTEVRVSARAADGGIEVRVHDHGPGVPPDRRAGVFDRFIQVRRDEGRGNRGLGLAFCKLAIEAHGGRIWIDDGPGAVFALWLGAPASSAAEPGPA